MCRCTPFLHTGPAPQEITKFNEGAGGQGVVTGNFEDVYAADNDNGADQEI